MALSIQDILGGSAITAVKGIIEEFHVSPELKAQMQAAVDANATTIRAKEIEYQEKLEDSYQTELNTASANIRAEMLTGDKFTVRARPSYIYWCELILGVNFVLFPLMGN